MQPRIYNSNMAHQKGCGKLNKKYIHYYNSEIYALYYRVTNTIYYNLNFVSETHIILFK